MSQFTPLLLVEDDANDIELALRAFERSRFGNPIVVARDGVDALDYLYARGQHALRAPGLPAAVLLDLYMPRLSGMEVLRTIKSDEGLRATPVVVLTSDPSDPIVPQCYALGANAYVVKPVGPQRFLDIIHAIGLFWTVVNRTPALEGEAA